MPLFTQVYRWVRANCWGNLTECWWVTWDGLASHPWGSNLRWTSIPSRGSINTPSHLMLQKSELPWKPPNCRMGSNLGITAPHTFIKPTPSNSFPASMFKFDSNQLEMLPVTKSPPSSMKSSIIFLLKFIWSFFPWSYNLPWLTKVGWAVIRKFETILQFSGFCSKPKSLCCLYYI